MMAGLKRSWAIFFCFKRFLAYATRLFWEMLSGLSELIKVSIQELVRKQHF